MRTLISLLVWIVSWTVGQSQNLKLPKKPYVLIIGNYKFISETVIEQSPDLSQGFYSESFGGTQLEMAGDSSNTEPRYPNGDSLRLWTYLFQNDTFRINYPLKVERIRVREISSGKSYIRYDTTDHVDINKVADTIDIAELIKLLNTEIQVFNGVKKMKIRTIGVRMIWPDGRQYYTNYDKNKFNQYPKIVEKALTLSPGGYFILDRVWYYNLEKEQDGMSGTIGWFIR
jgi:hypothetical protein